MKKEDELTKFFNSRRAKVMCSEIHPAEYTPRRIDDDARKKDEKRWLYGMSLKTNFRFSNRRSAYLKRAYLRKLGYEVAYKSNTAYYNKNTRRSERLERDYKCFKFIERQ